ncbi:hypothetical protein BurJ1DRAFT_1418 [Burkholderiales bacterium JOSHI_001]|nr:hypothetical protein BurJ1DRAFT_1418 [Burkholderiales bacterium JOSHI_001]
MPPPAPAAALPARLRQRPLEREDVPEALDLLPPWLLLPPAQRSALPELLSRLCEHPALVAGPIEDLARSPGQRLQGLGVTVILPQAFMAASIAKTLQGGGGAADLVAGVYAALIDGSLDLPDERAIGRANAADGIVFFALHYHQRNMDLQDPQALSVLNMANEAFRVAHSGHRIAAFYQAAPLAHEPYLLAAGQRRSDELPAGAPPDGCALFRITRGEAMAMLPGLTLRHVFEHTPPRFRLSASQRRLLWRSLFDERDDALMRKLDVSVHGLKKLWRGIYERIEDVEPEFFGGDVGIGAGVDDGKRGPEKRRLVLAYVRQRPEELRPWAP